MKIPPCISNKVVYLQTKVSVYVKDCRNNVGWNMCRLPLQKKKPEMDSTHHHLFDMAPTLLAWHRSRLQQTHY
jgi:hypothetical protein